MVSQGNDTYRLIPQTSFRLAGQGQPGLPNGQTPQIPVSFKAALREEKPHVKLSTVLITMNAVTTSPASPSTWGCEQGGRGRKQPGASCLLGGIGGTGRNLRMLQ